MVQATGNALTKAVTAAEVAVGRVEVGPKLAASEKMVMGKWIRIPSYQLLDAFLAS